MSSTNVSVTQLLIDLCGALEAETDTTGLSGEELVAAEAHNRDIMGLLDAITKYHIKININAIENATQQARK